MSFRCSVDGFHDQPGEMARHSFGSLGVTQINDFGDKTLVELPEQGFEPARQQRFVETRLHWVIRQCGWSLSTDRKDAKDGRVAATGDPKRHASSAVLTPP